MVKVQSVTHINHVSDEPHPADKVTTPCLPLSELMGTLAAVADAWPRSGSFIKNPKVLEEESVVLQKQLERWRDGIDSASILAEAEELKASTNALFKEGKNYAALMGYLAALWCVRPGKSCPMPLVYALASASDNNSERPWKKLADVPKWLQGAPASPATSGTEDAEAEGAAELRTSLHLNIAAASLKIPRWEIAKTACEQVLSIHATNAKALFRLAKAYEGEGDLREAAASLRVLIKQDPKNAEARKMFEVIKEKQAQEKSNFQSNFKTLFNGDTLADEVKEKPVMITDAPAKGPAALRM